MELTEERVREIVREELAAKQRGKREHPPVTAAWIAEMKAEFPTLDVDAEIVRAQNRKQYDDYRDKRRHLHEWLVRAEGWQRGVQVSAIIPPPPPWEVERARLEAQTHREA